MLKEFKCKIKCGAKFNGKFGTPFLGSLRKKSIFCTLWPKCYANCTHNLAHTFGPIHAYRFTQKWETNVLQNLAQHFVHNMA